MPLMMLFDSDQMTFPFRDPMSFDGTSSQSNGFRWRSRRNIGKPICSDTISRQKITHKTSCFFVPILVKAI